MDIDNILIELEIIGQLKENDKLAISVIPGDTKIFVSPYSWYNRFIRKYNGYSRDASIKHVELLVDRVEKTSNTIINGSLIDMCITIKISIKKSIDGLKNLKITYIDDSEIVARLIILINRLEKTLALLEDFNDNININYTSNFDLDIDNELPNYNTIDNTTNNISNNSDNIIDKNTDKIKKLMGESSSSKTHNRIDNQEINRDPNSDNKQFDNQDNSNQDNSNQDKEKSTLSNVVNNSKKQSTKNVDRQTSSLIDSNLKNFTLNNGKK